MMTKEEIQELKLTPEEKTKYDQFILKTTKENIRFSVLSDKPITLKATTQELIHDVHVSTLETYVEKLEKLEQQTGSQRLKKDKTYYVGSVSVTELADFVTYVVRNKRYTAWQLANSNKISQLEAKLNDLKTPQELRSEVEKQLHDLKAEIA